MENKIKQAEKITEELCQLYNDMKNDTEDLDLKRLFKQLEADMMDSKHKLALAYDLINKKS
jgi:hypothetical protein